MKSRYRSTPYACRAGCMLAMLTCLFTASTVAQFTTETSPGLLMESTGLVSIETDGHWLGQGSLLPGASTLILHGSHPQSLRQDGGSFYNVTVDKSGGDVTLAGAIRLEGTLALFNQDVALNQHMITLSPGALLLETPGNTVKGSAGYLTTSRILSAPADENIAGLGLILTSGDALGLTEIRRGHAHQSAHGQESIHRYFDVWPETTSGIASALSFLYDDSELNGNTEADLKMYRSPDDGVNWIEIDGLLNIAENRFDASDLHMFSRFTLSSHCLETCMATQAVVQPADIYLNSAGLAYLLPDMVNGGSRGACGIDSMTVFPEVFDCSSAGPQDVLFTVRDNNGCSKTANTWVNVLDTVRPVVLCKNFTVYVGESCSAQITPQDVDNGSYDACGLSLSINRSSFGCDDIGTHAVTLTATDPSGNTRSCIATITVAAEVSVECHQAVLDLGENGSVTIDPFALLTGSPADYAGYTFVIEPEILYCDELGEHIVTLLATDPQGEVTTCTTTLILQGPDADCDGVADPCDICEGGDDRQDTDGDGMPDCADWDGWSDLVEEWQCANNKVFVCHDGTVICINENAVQAHLDHGDFLGPCDATRCDENPALHAPSVHQPSGLSVMNANAVIDQHLQSRDDRQTNIRIEHRPNPFASEAMIRFHLPTRAWAALTIFDMTGQPIARLAEGTLDAGWHERIFKGQHLAEGIYLYRLQTLNHVRTGAMVLSR